MALCGYRWQGSWGTGPSGTPPNVEVIHVCTTENGLLMGHAGKHRCHCGLTKSEAPPAADPQHGALCQWKLPVGSPGWQTADRWAPCPECGHAAEAHVGCDVCPVCVLIWQSTPQWRRQTARMHGISWPG